MVAYEGVAVKELLTVGDGSALLDIDVVALNESLTKDVVKDAEVDG